MENIAVALRSNDGTTKSGEFNLWEEAPDNPDMVRLNLRFSDQIISITADNFFVALVGIRRELQKLGLVPLCFGASKDVYPSRMILSMGCAEKAYRLRLDCKATTKDLVFIFDADESVDPVSVEEQEEYYQSWLQSLK